MNRKRLQNDVAKKLHNMHHFARLITQKHDEEDIHQFRVNYKKLRSLLRMMHYNHHKKVLPKRFKQLYTAAGVTRDLQLHYTTIVNHFGQGRPMPVIYINHILQAISKASEDFDRLYRHCSFTRLSHIIKARTPHKYHKKIKYWQNDNVQAISSKLLQEPTDDTIHEIRKHTKDLLYTRRYLHLEKDYNPIATSTGSYIDQCVLLTLLDAHISYAPEAEQAILRDARQRWQKQKAQLKDEILLKLREMM